MKGRVVVLSGHDFRTPRKANMHYIAQELSREWHVSFVSVGFSSVAALRGKDPRGALTCAANTWSIHESVECYLDKRVVHPGGFGGKIPSVISDALFRYYITTVPDAISGVLDQADVIVVESGFAVAYLDYIFSRLKSQKVVYIASDDLSTINTAPFLIRMLERNISRLSAIRVPSALMGDYFEKLGGDVQVIPHGLSDPLRPNSVNPFKGGLNAVSVGSMLFDPSFFEMAAELRPDITFHVIGSGSSHQFSAGNVITYPEMVHEDTLAFLNYADFGVAPYRDAVAPYYLVDTSMKLMQYEHARLPAVCPTFAAGDKPGRFGYIPGDASSIGLAIAAALASPKDFAVEPALTWAQVADRVIEAPFN